MHRQHKWPAAVTRRLVELRDQGMSFDAIAEQLARETGEPYSRDMIAGKVTRLALPQHPIRLVRAGLPDVAVEVDGYLLRISIERLAEKKPRRSRAVRMEAPAT